MSRHNNIIIAIAALALTLCSLAGCAKEERELAYANQESAIEKYLQGKFPNDSIIRNNGANRVIIDSASSANMLEYGDTLYLFYAGYVFNGSPSALFATNVQSVAESAKFTLTDADFSPLVVQYNKGVFVEGLENGLFGVGEGEHSIILFSAKYGFGNDAIYNIPKLSALLYEVWIDKIIKNN